MIAGSTLAELGGDWIVDLNGKQLTTPLKSWEELATPSFAGPAIYRKQFTSVAPPAGKRAYLEIADVRDYARVKLNGKELEAHAWQPYRWDITAALKAGNNDLRSRCTRRPPAAEALAVASGNAGGRGRGGAPPVSGLLGPVRLVAY